MQKIVKQRVLLEIVFVLLNVFLTIFVYKNLGNIFDTVVANLMSYIGIFVSFVVATVILSWYKVNLKYLFSFGCFILAGSFGIFLIGTEKSLIYLFMFTWGIGQGFQWVGIHSNELLVVSDENKTKYVTEMGLIRRFITVVVPFILTMLFAVFSDNAYFIIFSTASLCALLAAFYAYVSFSYVPESVDWRDWSNFLVNAKVAPIKLFMTVDGSTQVLHFALTPLAAYLILTNEVNVGVYQTMASILSLGLLYFGMKKRSDSSNGKILLFSVFSYIPFLIFFALSPNVWSFLLLSVASVICLPQMSVSRHFIDLTIMKFGSQGNNKFYPNMIFREVFLFVGRLVSVAVFLYALKFLDNDMQMLSAGYLFLALLFSTKAILGYKVISKIGL
jgi:hypothetical protein